jgi:hypothetical protein
LLGPWRIAFISSSVPLLQACSPNWGACELDAHRNGALRHSIPLHSPLARTLRRAQQTALSHVVVPACETRILCPGNDAVLAIGSRIARTYGVQHATANSIQRVGATPSASGSAGRSSPLFARRHGSVAERP